LSWNADYVLTVSRDDKNADLDGWVTVVNNSGTAFHNARLQLVAGELNRVADRGTMGRSDMSVAVPMAKAAQQFQQESFSEYHLYSLGRKTSVEDKETKQISLLQGSGVPVEKILMVNGQSYYYRNQQTPGAPLKDPSWSITNSKMKRRTASAFRFLPATSASIRKTQKAAFSSPGKITLITPPKTKT